MSEVTPRRALLEAFESNLMRIQRAAGYRTDVGGVVTLEPGQLDPEAVDDGLAIYIDRQERPSEPAVSRTHRLTTVGVIVKRKAFGTGESLLDVVLDDIERSVLDRQRTWPKGHTAPAYLDMEPLRPPAGADWIGARIRFTSTIPIC